MPPLVQIIAWCWTGKKPLSESMMSTDADLWLSLNESITHWDRVMHICIGSDNGLSPGWHQAIIWTNARMLFIGTLGTNFNKILIKIQIFLFKKIHLKMSSGKWWLFCLGLNVNCMTVVVIIHSKGWQGLTIMHNQYDICWCSAGHLNIKMLS